MTTLPIRAAGFCWYRREDYARIRKLMSDGHKLPATFDSWLEQAQKGLQRFEGQGGVALKVYLDPTEFTAWCSARRLKLDSSARTQYAAEAAAKQYGRTH